MSAGAVRFDTQGNVLVARMSGEIDLSNAEELGVRVAETAPHEAPGVVLDLSDVEYIDSYGIFVIHGLRHRLAEQEQPLVLVVPPDGLIRRAIELVGLAEAMPIKEELHAALHVIGQPDTGDPPA